ncbi:hypothetical protein E4U56_003731, partial [Claviceps arundinis]
MFQPLTVQSSGCWIQLSFCCPLGLGQDSRATADRRGGSRADELTFESPRTSATVSSGSQVFSKTQGTAETSGIRHPLRPLRLRVLAARRT